MARASGTLGGNARVAQAYGGAGGCQKPGGALGGGGGGGGVSALRPLGLRAIPELRWWPGQAARRKAMLVQLHER